MTYLHIREYTTNITPKTLEISSVAVLELIHASRLRPHLRGVFFPFKKIVKTEKSTVRPCRAYVCVYVII